MSPERDFAQILNEALALCHTGRSLEDVLAQFPEEADQLAPLLETAHKVATVPPAQPPVGAESTSKARMMTVLKEKKKSGAVHQQNILDLLGDGLKGPRGKKWTLILVSLVVLFVIISAIAVAAVNALPGSFLYPAKTAYLETRIMLTLNPVIKTKRILHYKQILVEDLTRAVELGRMTAPDAQATMTAMPTPHP
ncbi:hypothetical protein KQH50_02770 [bacterium]|nr:hypothetical protein [bacterium]